MATAAAATGAVTITAADTTTAVTRAAAGITGPYAHHDYYRGFRTYPRYRYSGYSCDRWRWVATPWGWRQRHVNTCYQYYRSYYNFY
jgi:hypothetical protein